MTPHLLVVDDDARLRQLLKQYLSQSDFEVTVAENPKEAEFLLQLFKFDVIIMDVMMPYQNGLDYTKILRKRGLTTPILMLTAMGDVTSRITGLEAGADDYLPKPFDPKELLLRLKNILKHNITTQDTYTFGPFTYNIKTGILLKQNKTVALTSAEQQLLGILTHSINNAVSRETLAQKMSTDSIRTIDVQITRLRRKIELDPRHPIYIQTVRGQGYKLVRT